MFVEVLFIIVEKKNPATEVLNGMRVEVVGMTEQMENCCY